MAATLYFEVAADYEELIKMQNELKVLQRELNNTSTQKSADETQKLVDKISTLKMKMEDLVYNAAKTGTALEQAFASKLKSGEDSIRQYDGELRILAGNLEDVRKKMQQVQREMTQAKGQKLASLQNELKELISSEASVMGKISQTSSDKSEVISDLAKAKTEYNAIKGAIGESGKAMDVFSEKMQTALDDTQSGATAIKSVFGDLANSVKNIGIGYIGITGIQSFLSQVVEVRSQFQDIESSMRVFLGDAERAEEFVDSLKDYAYYNMFEFSDLVAQSKQLIAYGNDVKDVIPILDKLSEVATGTGNSLGQLTDMYNRAKSIGYVDSRGMQTWASQGIVLKDILRELGVQGNITKVTFDQLNMAINHVTSEGGMFHGVMNAQMQNISASIGQLQDNLSLMFNEIGESLEEPIRVSLDLIGNLVDNYEKIGKAIMTAVVAIGSYRAALVLCNTVEALHVYGLKDGIKYMTANTKAVQMLTKAMATLNKTVLANPYALVAIAIAALSTKFYELATAESAAEKGMREYNEMSKQESIETEERKQHVYELMHTMEDLVSTEEDRQDALNELKNLYPDIFDAYTVDMLKTKELTDAKLELAKAEKKAVLEKKRAALESRTKIGEMDTKDKVAYSLVKSTIETPFTLNPFNLLENLHEANTLANSADSYIKAAQQEDAKTMRANLETKLKDLSNADLEAQKKSLLDAIKGVGKDAEVLITDLLGTNVNEDLVTQEGGLFTPAQINGMIKAIEKQIEINNNAKTIPELAKSAREKIDEAYQAWQDLIHDNEKKYGDPKDYEKALQNAKNDYDEQVKDYNTKFAERYGQYSAPLERTYADREKSRNHIKELHKQWKDIERAGQGDMDEQEFLKKRADAEKRYRDAISAYNKTFSASFGKYDEHPNQTRDNKERMLRENELKAQRTLIDEAFDIRQVGIDKERNQAKKATDQRQLDFDKEQEQIKRQGEDKLKTIQERYRKEWEERNKQRGENDAVFDINSLSDKDLEQYKREKDSVEKWVKAKQDLAQYKFDDITELLKTYKSYDAQRNELDAEYVSKRMQLMEALAKAEKDGNQETIAKIRSALEEQLNAYSKSVASLATQKMNDELDKLKSDPTYFAAFQNIEAVGTEALINLKARLMDMRETLTNLPPDQLKTITDLLNSIDEQIDVRNPLDAMKRAMKELGDAEIEAKASREELANIDAMLAEEELNLAEAREMLNKATKGTDEYETAQGYLAQTQNRITKLTNDQLGAQNKLNNAQTRYYNAQKRINTETDKTYEVVQQLADVFDQIAQAIGGAAGDIVSAIGGVVSSLSDVGKQLNELSKQRKANETQSEIVDGIDVARNLDKGSGGESEGISSGLAAASAVLSGFQAGMSVGSSMVNLLEKTGVTSSAKYEKYAKKLAEINDLHNSVNRYKRAAMEAELAEKHWFGNSGLNALQDAWKTAEQTQKSYFDTLNERQAKYLNQSKHDGDWLGNVVVGSLAGAITGFAVGGPIGAMLGGVIGGAAGATTSFAEQALFNSAYSKQMETAQNNLRIETRKKKKSFMGIGGHNQKTADLRQWAKENYGEDLFDAEGWINVELAQEIISTYGEKLQGETQKTLEELIELKEQYDEYQDALEQYVSSLYEPLVDNMVDSIWAWYDTGVDALSKFKDAASDTFRSIVNDMMKQIVLNTILDGYQDKIKDLYDSFNRGEITYNQLMLRVSNATAEVAERYENGIPVLQDMVTTMGEQIKEITGVDIKGSASSTGSATGVANGVTADVANEINGRLTAVQIQGEQKIGLLTAISENQLRLLTVSYSVVNGMDGILQQIAASHLELVGIHEDTTEMRKMNITMTRYMNDWDNHIKKL